MCYSWVDRFEGLIGSQGLQCVSAGLYKLYADNGSHCFYEGQNRYRQSFVIIMMKRELSSFSQKFDSFSMWRDERGRETGGNVLDAFLGSVFRSWWLVLTNDLESIGCLTWNTWRSRSSRNMECCGTLCRRLVCFYFHVNNSVEMCDVFWRASAW